MINLGDKLENIKINISDNFKDIIQVSPKEIDNLNEADSKKIQLTIKTDEIGIFYGKIKAFSGNLSAQSDLIINSLEKGKNITQPSQSCLSQGGIGCEENQNCEGSSVSSSDSSKCCIGNCIEKKSYTGLIIGIILIIAVIALIFFLYKKSKKARVSPEEILRKKQTEIETKIIGKEVKGNLSR